MGGAAPAPAPLALNAVARKGVAARMGLDRERGSSATAAAVPERERGSSATATARARAAPAGGGRERGSSATAAAVPERERGSSATAAAVPERESASASATARARAAPAGGGRGPPGNGIAWQSGRRPRRAPRRVPEWSPENRPRLAAAAAVLAPRCSLRAPGSLVRAARHGHTDRGRRTAGGPTCSVPAVTAYFFTATRAHGTAVKSGQRKSGEAACRGDRRGGAVGHEEGRVGRVGPDAQNREKRGQ
jgi:hypothetical protein